MPPDPRVAAHLDGIGDPVRRGDARRLAGTFAAVTGWAATLWPGGVVGYGRYEYRYDSGRAGASFATGFAVRAREFALHIQPGYTDFPAIAERLGPHRRGKSCWYLRSLDAVEAEALAELIRAGLDDLRRHWPVAPT